MCCKGGVSEVCIFFIFPSQIQRGRIDSPHTALPKGWARRKAEAKLPHSTWFELLRRDTSASLFPHGHAVTQNPPHRESACVSTPDLKFSRPSDPGSQGPWQLGLCEGARWRRTLSLCFHNPPRSRQPHFSSCVCSPSQSLLVHWPVLRETTSLITHWATGAPRISTFQLLLFFFPLGDTWGHGSPEGQKVFNLKAKNK